MTVAGELVWLGSHGSEEEARGAVSAARQGRLPAGELVGDWFARWPRIAHARRARSTETIALTLSMSRSFVQRFGAQRLDRLERSALVSWAIDCPGAVRWARTVLADAVWAGLVESNPLTGVRVALDELAVVPPTELDVARLMGRAPVFGLPAAFVGVAAYSGLRLSEVAALEARDVVRSIDRVSLLVRRGKGGHARESILFRPVLLEGLPEEGLLFRRAVSRRPWDRKAVNGRWVKLREDVGMPETRFHDLRHFHATWLLDRGASDLDVAVQLGHTDGGELVRRRYGHPSTSAALDRLGAVAA